MITIIPAHPGFSVVKRWNSRTDDPYTEIHPIIAWVIETQDEDGRLITCPTPIVVESVNDPYAIEYPDGRVILQADAEFATRKEWEEAADAPYRVTDV